VELCGLFQLHGGCNPADGHVGPVVVVCPEPIYGLFLGLLDGFKDVFLQPFVADGAVVALDIGILLGLSRLDILDVDASFLSSYLKFAANVFRAIADPDYLRFAAPFNDPVQAAHLSLSR